MRDKVRQVQATVTSGQGQIRSVSGKKEKLRTQDTPEA